MRGTCLVTWLVGERGIPQGQPPMVLSIADAGQAVAQSLGRAIADWAHGLSAAP